MAVNEREVVLDMLLSLREGKLSHTILKDTLDSYLYLDKSSRGFITRLYEGTIEKRLYLDYIIDGYSKTPVKKMKPVIMLLLEISVYQLFFMDRVPDSAAINEAVKLTKKRGLTGISGFVNGVLRNIARNKESIVLPDKNKDNIKYLEIKYSTPKAVVEHFINDYGSEKAEELLEAFEEKRPLTARATKGDREELIKKLEGEGVKTGSDTVFPESVRILELDNLSYLESFENGDFVIQDESSQFIGKIVSLPNGARVLDLCAAPGGKSLLFAEMEEVDEIISCDITESKTELIEDNVRRIGADTIRTKVNDASMYNPDFLDGFDLVICDLPCSGLGVMGRKRDIKYNVSIDKIRELAILQKKILENAVRYVKKGGRLIYSTCTMTKAENEENFTFISEFKGFSAVDFSDKIRGYVDRYKDGERLVNEAKKGFIRLIPGELGTDGFFVSEYMREE